MARPKKITWKVIFDDFKSQYPKQSKSVLGFEPYDYATIKLLFPDRVRMSYNYDTKQLVNI